MSQTDAPLQALPYLPPTHDIWPAVLSVLSVVATVFAALILFTFAAQLGMSFAGSRSFSAGLRLDFSDLRTAVATLAQFADGAGAIVVLCGSVGRQSARPSARMLMLVGCCIIVAAELLTWGFRILLMFGGSPSFPRSLGAMGMGMYLAYTLGYTLSRALLPALTIWVLRRPVIRQQYEGSVSLG